MPKATEAELKEAKKEYFVYEARKRKRRQGELQRRSRYQRWMNIGGYWIMAMSRSSIPSKGTRSDAQWPGTDNFAKRFPILTKRLTETEWEGGEERIPDSISIYIKDGCLRATLNDRDADQICYAGGHTMEQLFLDLESIAKGDRGEWLESSFSYRDRHKKRKKG